MGPGINEVNPSAAGGLTCAQIHLGAQVCLHAHQMAKIHIYSQKHTKKKKIHKIPCRGYEVQHFSGEKKN